MKAIAVNRQRESQRSRCMHCQKIGHERSNCYELVGYSLNWGRRRNPRANQGGGEVLGYGMARITMD